MDNEKKSFRPDGTVEHQNTTTDNYNSEQTHSQEDWIIEQKDERQSYQDYNGNSEANAPAKAREE